MSGSALATVCGSDGRISAHGDGVLTQRLYAAALHQKLSCTGSAALHCSLPQVLSFFSVLRAYRREASQTSYRQYLNTATLNGRMKPDVIG